jgi:O-antigen/teichoic acid export membrane protein
MDPEEQVELLTETRPETNETGMIGQIRKLVGHSAVYGVGLIASSINSILLTPLYLHLLNRSEYGTVELLTAFRSIMTAVLTLGVAGVLPKVYINDCKSDLDRKVLLSSMIVFTAAGGLAVLLLSLLFARPLAVLLFKSGEYTILVRLAAISSGCLLVQMMGMIYLRIRQWPFKFVLVSISQIVFTVAFSMYLVWARRLGVLGVQLAVVLATILSLSTCMFLIRSGLTRKFSMTAVRRVLILSLPVMPSTLAPWVLNLSDRYFLNHFVGLSETGLYAVGYRVGMMGLVLMINAFQWAWGPFFLSSSDESSPRLCTMALKYYLSILIVVGLSLSMFAPEILRVISKPEFWSAHWIVPFIALSYLLYGAQLFTMPMFIRVNKGKWLSYIMGGAAVVNLALNSTLIPRYGMRGAVAATLLSFAAMAIPSFVIVNRFYPVRYDFASIAKILGASTAVYLIYRDVSVTSLLMLVLKLTSFIVLALLLLALKYFNQKEMKIVRSIPGRVVQRLSPQPGKSA